MLEIILQVLSVLGVLLLVLFIIALILLVLVLFFPISYRFSASKQLKDIRVTARAKWLFGAFRVNYAYPEPGTIVAKLLWFKIFDSGALPEEEPKLQPKEKKKSVATQSQEKTATNQPIANTDSDTNDSANSTAIESENTATEENEPKKNFLYTIRNICDKIKMIWENISYYLDLLKEDNTRELFSHICLRLGKILKNIRPKSMEADILFGTGSPDTTGYLYGIYWMLFPALGNKFLVTPDFEQAILKGNIKISGRITVAVLIVNALKVAFDRKLHLFIRKLKVAPGMNAESK